MIYETDWYIMSTDQMSIFDSAAFHCFSPNLIPIQNNFAKHIFNLKN